MSKQRNVNDGNIPDILRRLYRLERQAMLAHSSIGREGLEVYDGGWIRILNGGLQVIGTATISGTLDVTGTTNLKGQTSVTGPMEISGTTNITGNTNIMGELNVTGPTTLDGVTEVGGNFEITTGGKFKAGTVEINPDGSAKFGDMTIDADGLITTGQTKIDTSGKAEFGDFIIDPNSNFPIQAPGGKMVSGGPGQIGLTSDTGAIDLSPTVSQLSYNTTVFSLSSAGAQLIGQLVLASVPSAPASNLIPLGIDSSGNVRRIA